MDNFNVYKDIQARTKGEIYIGVVGPVRTGKSTFIKRFMELAVLPAMEDESLKAVSTDELPQSAGGKTVMTMEPKFIPKEAVQITLGDGIQAKVRLIDCVGYMVDGAAGHVENGEERMVKTPWSEKEIPFTQAAQIGTRKVIGDHSTIGIVVTTDGSVGELKRSAYIDAEKQTVDELKKLGKPFILLLNSTKPYSDETLKLAEQLAADYGVTVLPVSCEQLKKEDIFHILESVLKEFPVTQLDFHIPKWLEVLPATHWLKTQVIDMARELLKKVSHMKDAASQIKTFGGSSGPVEKITIEDIANEVGLSQSHFMKYFKNTMGTSFVDYLNEYRLTMASRLLISSDSSILAIASEVGFENLSYFNRIFKKRFGQTPREYRRRQSPA